MDICPGYGQGGRSDRRNLSELGREPKWRRGLALPTRPCFCSQRLAVSTRDWLARSFRHAIDKWLPSDATNRETEWSRDRLVSLLKERLSGIRVVVVANREPYIHKRTDTPGGEFKWIRPASGLVTA